MTRDTETCDSTAGRRTLLGGHDRQRDAGNTT